MYLEFCVLLSSNFNTRLCRLKLMVTGIFLQWSSMLGRFLASDPLDQMYCHRVSQQIWRLLPEYMNLSVGHKRLRHLKVCWSSCHLGMISRGVLLFMPLQCCCAPPSSLIVLRSSYNLLLTSRHRHTQLGQVCGQLDVRGDNKFKTMCWLLLLVNNMIIFIIHLITPGKLCSHFNCPLFIQSLECVYLVRVSMKGFDVPD